MVPKVILFKKETTYGTDATPTVIANAMLTRGFTSTPIEADQIQRDLDVPNMGRLQSIPSNPRKRASFRVEIAGSGTVDTVPAWMELLECCGMAAATVTAATKVEQKMAAASAALSAGTMYDWHGNQKRVGLGGRGTFGWNFTAGDVPVFNFDFTFMLPAANQVIQDVPGTPTLSRWKTPLEVNTVNTDFLLGGYALKLQSFTGDANATITPRNLVGANYVKRGNHAITGRILGETPDISAKSYFSSLMVGDHIPVQLIHGVAAGSIVQVDSSNLQITSIDITEQDEVSMIDIGYGLDIVAGQDDLLFTSK